MLSYTKRIKRTLLKTLKDNNTKITKDVLLHQIFQEISEEDKEINGENYLLDEIAPVPKTKLSKIREIQKKRQWFFIAILVISIIYVLFDTETPSLKNEENKDDTHSYSSSKTNQISHQEEEQTSQQDIKKMPKLRKKIHIEVTERKTTLEKPIQKQPQEIVLNLESTELQQPQSEREKAKEALFMQMQN